MMFHPIKYIEMVDVSLELRSVTAFLGRKGALKKLCS